MQVTPTAGTLCQNLGLNLDPGNAGVAEGLSYLVAQVLGVERNGATAPTGLYQAFETANYEYHGTDGSADLNLALASYLAW